MTQVVEQQVVGVEPLNLEFLNDLNGLNGVKRLNVWNVLNGPQYCSTSIELLSASSKEPSRIRMAWWLARWSRTRLRSHLSRTQNQKIKDLAYTYGRIKGVVVLSSFFSVRQNRLDK